MKERDAPRGPGWLPLYAVSFVLMLAAGVVLMLAARDFLRSLTSLWISVGLSTAAIIAALLGLLRRRRR